MRDWRQKQSIRYEVTHLWEVKVNLYIIIIITYTYDFIFYE